MYFFPAVLFVCHALGMATAGDFWRNLKMSVCASSVCVCGSDPSGGPIEVAKIQVGLSFSCACRNCMARLL